ncbi:Putative DNA-binding domain-containing protein [Flavobacterium sp. CF108]|uniref:HvfC/BufC N-terminal domain-containing protein n=1 Tax=unclassified Flavobacterium TaxID=196869 RepID=UPI0008B186C2|nr:MULTISPECIES: DNA-binding domain-containing protein [unclassified Flavobacterium]SEO19875.1 Putative DNA-binding domain-containing protein [Flavobacterium sp. fv08]SHG53267.1 Putative DNA-binding domain-containing protein [Flavobacterium sp. CF108]
MQKTVKIPLQDFQQWMQQLLLDPYQQTGVNPNDLLSNAENAASIEDVICHSEKLTAQEHLAIYQRSYIARLRNCMSQQFSALEYTLGEAIFCAFADDYLASKPSHNYNLSFLGANFAEYLENNRPDANEDIKEDWIDFMIELAKFEYAIGVLFDEKADENYQLATIDTPENELKLVPVFSVFKFQFPVRKYYSEFKNDKNPDLPLQNESYCVVLRHKFKLSIYDLHKEQYDFLCFLKEHQNIAAAKEIFKNHYKENDLQFEQVWNSWKERWVGANFFRT